MRTSTDEQIQLQRAISMSAKDKNKDIKTIASRFGPVDVDISKKISFKHGILGIPTAVSFCLTELPDISTDQFKLLQCLEDDDLSFIVVPSQYDNQLLEQQDLVEACKVIDIDTNNLVILFIATIHETDNERYVSVNAKAPVLVDAVSRNATQYVLQNPSYRIQHRIS